jgi:hypothetical protein
VLVYRRRRIARESIAFSFDSFLDVVANVIGIIVRLILVAWVGARSYSAAIQKPDEPPLVALSPAVKPADDPVSDELEQLRRHLADARLHLLDRLGKLDFAEQEAHATEERVAHLQDEDRVLAGQIDALSGSAAAKGKQAKKVVASAGQLRKRMAELLREIKEIEAEPPQRQVLRYHTPVSRAVHTDEVFFECRDGRVTFIDLPAFIQEVRAGLEDRAATLKSQWQVTATTSAVGAFRLRYVVEREKSALEGIGGSPVGGNFRYGLSEWVVEPVALDRGEPLDVALREESEFRRLADRIDPQITVVTFWVYADSFELFRRLRDHLYERGVEVAGRPLPDGAPIAASRHGTASRGQ